MATAPYAAPRDSRAFAFPGSTVKTFIRVARRPLAVAPSSAAPAGEPAAAAPGGVLVDRFRLSVGAHLSGKINVARKVLAALHSTRLARHRVLEVWRLKSFVLWRLPASRLGDGPLNGKARIVVAGRHREQLEIRVVFIVLSPETPKNISVRSGERGDRPAGLLKQRKRADQRWAEIRDDDVDLGILGDLRGQNLLSQRRVPVRHVEWRGIDELVFRPENRLEAFELIFALAVAGRGAEEKHIAAVRQNAFDPVAPVYAVVLDRRAYELGVILAGLAADFDAIENNDLAGLKDAGQSGQHRRTGVAEYDQRVGALGRHALDVRDRLLRIALPIGVLIAGDIGALLRFLFGGSSRDQTPAVAAKAIEKGDRRLLRPAP